MIDRAPQARRFPWGIWLLGTVLLLPILTFPAHTDHAIFLRGGMTLLEGGTLYTDFVDVKPPLIYLLYAIPAALFGTAEVGFRALDVIWQSGALAMLLLALHRADASRFTMGSVVVLQALLYVTLHGSQTGHVEGFMTLPLATIIWAMQARASVSRDLLIGLCLSIIILLKYTLGIVAIALVAYVFLDGRDRRIALVESVRWAIFSVVGIIALIIPLLVRPGFLDGWKTVMDYLSVYAGYPPVSVEVIREWLKQIGTYTGDNISLMVTLSAAAGAALAVGRRTTEPMRALLLLAALLLGFLMVTLVMERRFPPYQFSRLYLPLSILAGAGFTAIAGWLRVRMRSTSLLQRAIVLPLVFTGLLLSPLPRYVSVLRLSAMSLVDQDAYARWFSSRPLTPDHQAINDLLATLKERAGPSDHTMFMTVTASMIVPFIPGDSPSPYCDSHIYFGYGVPEEWRKGALAEMRRTDWLVIDTEDRHLLVNLHERTSYESLQRDPDFRAVLESTFEIDTAIGPYRIYHRKDR